MKKYFYITTTLPYVNAQPHIGFALEIIQADTIARYKRLSGYQVCFNFGTDEHGLKIFREAKKAGKAPQKFCDEYATKFNSLKTALNLSYTNFIRTTDKYHIEATQEFWQRCLKNNDIYKKNYRIRYCVGCELEKTDSELIDNRCPIHPNLELEIFEEKNYFFRFSKYQKLLLELYDNNPNFVVPEEKLREIKTFVEKGLVDFSISRLKKKMPWGIDVPDDPDQVMYVWFDALINYISTIGWPNKPNEFTKWWPVVQVAGKDNLRQQSAIWQAMLMSAGLPASKQIFIHGFITAEGQKMSKSLGNVTDPFDLVNRYGTDALRYYLLREIPSYGDGDFSQRRFREVYNADLANGLGNLISRVARLGEGKHFSQTMASCLSNELKVNLEKFRFDNALSYLWKEIRSLDKYIDKNEPWKIKDERKLTKILQLTVNRIIQISFELQPFLPITAETILKQFTGSVIKSQPPLFPRLK